MSAYVGFVLTFSTLASARLAFIDDALQKGPPSCLDSGPYIFTPVASSPADFQTESFAAIESALHNHPSAKLIVLGTLPAIVFAAYQKEGYCALSVPVDFNMMDTVIRDITGLSEQQMRNFLADGSHKALSILWQTFIVCVQYHYGGIYLPHGGMLLGSVFAKVSTADASSRPIFIEWNLPHAMDWALKFEEIAQPRSHTDVKSLEVAICWDWQICLWYFPNSAQALIRSLATKYMQEALISKNIDSHQISTLEMRSLLRDQRMVLLPFWMFTEPHFPDHYVEYADEASELEMHSQLYTPRPHREHADWTLAWTIKLWVPFSYGPRWARGALKNSMMDIAFHTLSLHLSPIPYKTLFDGPSNGPYDRLALHDPTDITARFVDRDVLKSPEMRSGGVEYFLPGIVGGYRSFGRTRVVGKSASGIVRLRIRTSNEERFFCRVEARPVVISATDVHASTAFSRCQSGVHPDEMYAWSASGSIQEVNAAIDLLSYRATNVSEPFSLAFATLEDVPDSRGAMNEPVTKEWMLLQEDVDHSVTIAAHSGGRCDLVTRMAESMQLGYPGVRIVATCECEEGAMCNYEMRRSSSLPLTIYDVPYDIGLARGKMFLTSVVTTEFVLILDDDFVLSTHSCLECMALHLRSNWRARLLPLDLVGFPVVEDERNFGAYRGTMRVHASRLLLEPFTKESTPDGCFRVDFCPMVYLARTDRMRTFKWKPELKVGEHEHFFYSNMRQGITSAVCFDSSFAHARKRNTESSVQGKYDSRRDRIMTLMLEAFASVGIISVMYNFHKYAHHSTKHFDTLMEKKMPPWQVRDNTGEAGMEPVADVMLTLMLVFSPPANEEYRMHLRSPSSWLQRLNNITSVSKPSFAFVVPIGDPMNVNTRLEYEMNEFRDMIFVPGQMEGMEASGEMLKFLFTFIGKRFQFRWLMVSHDNVYINPDVFIDFMGEGNSRNEANGGTTVMAGQLGDFVDGLVFVMCRDIALLLTYPQLLRKLSTARTATETLNRWVNALNVQILFFPATELRNEDVCRNANAWIVHPASVQLMINATLHPHYFACAGSLA